MSVSGIQMKELVYLDSGFRLRGSGMTAGCDSGDSKVRHTGYANT